MMKHVPCQPVSWMWQIAHTSLQHICVYVYIHIYVRMSRHKM